MADMLEHGSVHVKEKNFISVVVYLHNDEDHAVRFFKSLNKTLNFYFENFEFIAVDDVCTDDTIGLLREWSDEVKKAITIIHMSLYHGVEDAMNAGIDAAIGDFIYEFDSTQMPYDMGMAIEAYNQSLAGNDIVCVCPDRIECGSGLFYKVFNKYSRSTYKLQTDAFRLVTRRAVNRVHSLSTFMPYRKAAYAASGLKMTSITFIRKSQKYSKVKGIACSRQPCTVYKCWIQDKHWIYFFYDVCNISRNRLFIDNIFNGGSYCWMDDHDFSGFFWISRVVFYTEYNYQVFKLKFGYGISQTEVSD